jgi:hypothetical protein
MTVTGVAVVFYLSLAAFVFGGIRAIRASVERKVRDPLGIGLTACGFAGFVLAVVLFVASPHHENLPF